MTEELCCWRLQGLARGKLIAFVGAGLGSLVTVIMDVMTTLVDGFHPTWEQVTETDFIRQVKTRMCNFLEYKAGATIDGVGKNVLYGRDAAAEYYTGFVVEVAKSPNGCRRVWSIGCGGQVRVTLHRGPAEGLGQVEARRSWSNSWSSPRIGGGAPWS